MNETLYFILTGTVSAVAAWVIINAIKYIYQIVKDFTTDIKQLKRDIEELKTKIKDLEER